MAHDPKWDEETLRRAREKARPPLVIPRIATPFRWMTKEQFDWDYPSPSKPR